MFLSKIRLPHFNCLHISCCFYQIQILPEHNRGVLEKMNAGIACSKSAREYSWCICLLQRLLNGSTQTWAY